jgi:MFS family permease
MTAQAVSSLHTDAPSQNEFAKGWRVLLASTVGVGLGSTGLVFFSFGQFIRPISTEFHWGRGAISGGILCLHIGTVLVSPLIGYAIDRIGIRSIAILSQIGLAIGLLLLSLVNQNIWTFYAAWLALSFLGSGTSPISWTRAVAGFFVKYRGLALGIVLSGTGIAAVLAPPGVNTIITDYGWRTAYCVLGAIVLCSVPLTYFFLPRSNDEGSRQSSVHAGLTLPEAMRTFAFWRIVGAFIFAAIAAGGLAVHLPGLLVDRGFTIAAAARTFGYVGYAIISGRLLLGSLMDRFSPTLTGGIFILFASLASLLLATNAPAFISLLLFGLFSGAEVDVMSFLMGRIFGLKHYAQIYGWGISAFTLGAGLGPTIFGFLQDRSHSNELGLYAMAICPALSAVLVFSLKRVLASSPYRELQRVG